MSSRYAKLMSKWNSYHTAAKNDHQWLSASYDCTLPSYGKSVTNRATRTSLLTITRDDEKRESLRVLRKSKIDLLAKREEAERLARERELRHRRENELAAQRAQAELRAEAAKSAAAIAEAKDKAQSHTENAVRSSGKKSEAASVPARADTPRQNVERSQTIAKPESGTQQFPQTVNEVKQTVKPQLQKSESTDEDVLLKQAEDGLRMWREVSTEAEQFRSNTALKRARLTLRKRVNLAVNQIAASVKQVWRKVVDLTKIVAEMKASYSTIGESFVMKMIAERLISESDGSAALSKTTAFAVAAVIVSLTASVENVKKFRFVFLGAFYDHCIYTIPRYEKRRRGESVDDYKTRIGYKEGEDAESYLERMCGCVNLFAAVVQTEEVYTAQRIAGARNPFPLSWGWCILARLCNKEQRSITPSIAYAYLEISGYRLSREYGLQFKKLMYSISEAVVKRAIKSAPKGPTTRLQIFVEDFEQAGFVVRTPPEGRKLPRSDAENT
ncbi:RNA export mediator [Gracilaria domingensis]|nr:RNA export mediator [Gracilaria domingensis]